MSTLRKQLFKVALNNPGRVRNEVLALIAAEGGPSFEEFVKGKKFHNPETGNDVQFDSLPSDTQKKIREHWMESERGGTKEDKDHSVKEELKDYKLSIVGDNKERASYIAKKVKEGIDKSADICKLSPPVCHGNLGLSRDNMPQVLGGKTIKELLNSKKEDEQKKGKAAVAAGADPDSDKSVLDQLLDDLKKEGKTVKTTKIPVGKLKATQSEIKAGKTFGMADSYYKGEFDPSKGETIVVSSDNHILDGHHRWAALLVADPDKEMEVIKVSMPMKAFLKRSLEQPGVFRADLQDNVIDESKPVDLGDGPVKIKKKERPSKKATVKPWDSLF